MERVKSLYIIDSGLEIESLNLGMGQSEIPASQILSDDLVMIDPSILRRGGGLKARLKISHLE